VNDTILGCDCSSYSIGCVFLNGEGINPVTIHGGQQNDFDKRVSVMFHEFRKLLKENKPKAVYIEGAVYLQNVKTTLMIARVIDMIIANCIDQDVYYQVIDNKSWKKSILGNGKATKEQIANFAQKKWGETLSTQDLYDASLIALYGWVRLATMKMEAV